MIPRKALILLISAATTHDQDVFSFYLEDRFCNGFEEVLNRYREIVPRLRLAGSVLNDNTNSRLVPSEYFKICALQRSMENNYISSLAGPTSFAPIIEMAITIVEQSGGQYHVLLIIADGQVLQFFQRSLAI